jgi:hypothetical protein
VKIWLALAVLLPGLAVADGVRTVVPISQTVLPDNDIRYSVPVTIGDAPPMQALLDTGSTGLRVLDDALPESAYQDTGAPTVYSYGSGEQLNGSIGNASVAVGAESSGGPVPFEIVHAIACAAFAPNCPARNLAEQNYGIGGDGISGQGFKAILGASMAPAVDAVNPLAGIGAKRWIIELPEPGAAKPGTLIFNPDDDDLAGFQMFPLSQAAGGNGWQDLLPGCLNDTSAGQNICGPTVLDTGSPGIIAYRPGGVSAVLWTPDDAASLSFDGGGTAASVPFTADSYPGSGMIEAPDDGEDVALVAGVLPFFAYDVLYDAAGGSIGLRPRADAPDMTAAPAGGNAQTQIEVIQMNAPGAPGVGNAAPAAPVEGGGRMRLPVVIGP